VSTAGGLVATAGGLAATVGGLVVIVGLRGSFGVKFVPDKTGTETVKAGGICAGSSVCTGCGLTSIGAGVPNGRMAMTLARTSRASPIPADQYLIERNRTRSN